MSTKNDSTDDSTAVEDDDAEQSLEEYLADLDDGAGCAELWEHMSEQRDE